jgi:hypothetical protein
MKNSIFAAVEGTLVMAGESVNLGALQTMAADMKVDILLAEQDVRRSVRAVVKKWWCSFGYDCVLATIRAKLREVTAHV